MNIDAIVNQYLQFIDALPTADKYKFFHGNFGSKSDVLDQFLKPLKLTFSQYKYFQEQTEQYIDRYVDLVIDDKPLKKKKKVVDSP